MKKFAKQNKSISLITCSNFCSFFENEDFIYLCQILKNLGFNIIVPKYLQNKNYEVSGEVKAQELMAFYKDPNISYIFDLSGGDTANELLDFLDFEVIKSAKKLFFGYSDLTTIINAIYTKTGISSIWYQPSFIVKDLNRTYFPEIVSFLTAFDKSCAFVSPKGSFLQGNFMQGIVVGGNARCFLKLAGTAYFPDCRNKILLLEANSGLKPQLITYLSQLRSMGIFNQISGLLLGTFTEYERNCYEQNIFASVISSFIPQNLPVFKTNDIGHAYSTRGIMIGEKYKFEANFGQVV